MDLTLRYDGDIPSGQNGDKHSDVKQTIREKFSSQLRTYWRGSQTLSKYVKEGLPEIPYVRGKPCRVETLGPHRPLFKVALCGFMVMPLVTWHNGLACDLEITFLGDAHNVLRPEGDLDNRLKIVFDALRMPLHSGEVPATMFGSGDEDLFCLFEDDSLIKKFSVEARLAGTSQAGTELTVKASVKAVEFSHALLLRL